MAFTPITSNQAISYVRNRTAYRNANRETYWGIPVYFTPSNWPYNTGGGYGGPRYEEGYNYDNSPNTSINGNCTWWCCGRLYETMGTQLGGMGDGWQWYGNYSGPKSENANNINPGDIIVLKDGGSGHVMFVEKVSGNTITISQSAYSSRSVWNGKACLVTTFQKSEIVKNNTINMYKGLDNSPAYETVMGVIHTGDSSTPPDPPVEEDTPTITVSPSSYTKTMNETEDYVDFPFTITVTGIPEGYNASGNNTYPGLDRVANSGWTYTNYTVGGTTYRRATKTQTLRYTRESNDAYSTTKYMYFDFTYPNGSTSSTTTMRINVLKKKSNGILMLEWYGGGLQIL